MNINFKVIDKACKEFPLVRFVFNDTIAKLYGSQEEALDKIGVGGDRLCEMLFVDDNPKGIIVYKKDLQGNKELELKTLCLLDHSEESGRGYGSALLDRVHDIAESRKAEHILVTVSSKSPALGFFKRKGFKVEEQCPDKYMKGATENILSCAVEKRRTLTNTLSNAAINNTRTPILFQAPRANVRPDHTCTLRREYIDAISSGKKTFEGRVATPHFKNYVPGKIIKWESRQNAVTTEIVSRHEFGSFGEMLNKLGHEKFVPEVRNLEEAKRLYDNIPGYAEKVRRFGALALELKVVDVRNESRPASFNERSNNTNYSDNNRELGRKRSYPGNSNYDDNYPNKRRRM